MAFQTSLLDEATPLLKAHKIRRVESEFRSTHDGNIAAIDFGTSFVSVAFVCPEKETYKDVNTLVLDYSSNSTDTRTPNAILLSKEGTECKVAAFGENAQNLFSSMKPDKLSQHIYFERIKMFMKQDKMISRKSTVESFSEERYYLVEVIAFILKHLGECLIDHLTQAGLSIETTDFDWVITVPVIWDARGKRMMREAAYLAGLLSGGCGITSFTPVSSESVPICPTECNSDRLSLALEPEAAAIYSQTVTAQQFVHAKSQSGPGTKSNYMVIDIGGGTVDITAHAEVDGGVYVPSIPTGNEMGGATVNKQFSRLLEEIVDDVNFEQFLRSRDYSQQRAILNKLLYNEFEQQKLLFEDGKIEEICVDLPSKFVSFYTESKIKEGSKLLEGVQFSDDTLFVSQAFAEKMLFGPGVQAIIESTKKVLSELNVNIHTIYLVGGYGGTKYIYEKVKHALNCHQYDIIVPTNPSLAVVQGAVIWKKNPQVIKARRADATYGICLCQDFDESKHDSFYKLYSNDLQKYICNHVFCVFLQKGELLETDMLYSINLTPFTENKSMTVTIYSTPNTDVQYIVDKQGQHLVTKIGELVIDTPNPANLPLTQRFVDVEMDFCGTEIKARAKYRITGQEIKIVCDFLS